VVADQSAATASERPARLIKHTRYYWLLLAENHLTKRLLEVWLRYR
jgi:hypothetical protein